MNMFIRQNDREVKNKNRKKNAHYVKISRPKTYLKLALSKFCVMVQFLLAHLVVGYRTYSCNL